MDYRKQATNHDLNHIGGAAVEKDSSFNSLGVVLSDDDRFTEEAAVAVRNKA